MTRTDGHNDCCTPARADGLDRDAASAPVAHQALAVPVTSTRADDPGAQMVDLTGGTFVMGTNDPGAHPLDGEGPVREITVSPFRIDAVAVTNERFGNFVDATGYETEFGSFRLVVRFCRLPSTRSSLHPVGAAGAMVAAGVRRSLAQP